jgi:polyprenyl P-hydroxybenzoate/phenylacrylic acid decarboxylase-like protein
LAFLLALFPIFVNSLTGLGEIEPDILDLSKLAGGSRFRIFRMVRLMHATPYIADALKVAFPLALVGSIVGEFIGGNKGIGYLVLSAQFSLDTPLVFAALFSITLFTTLGDRTHYGIRKQVPEMASFATLPIGAFEMTEKRRIIVGISGASGIVYGVRMLEALRAAGLETHLVMTRSAQITLGHEMPLKPADVFALADVNHRVDNLSAAISSGSFETMGMVVSPCSIRSLSEIATGVTSSLLSRAADVVLKERRRLVLMVRETPLHLGHLRTMTQVTEMGRNRDAAGAGVLHAAGNHRRHRQPQCRPRTRSLWHRKRSGAPLADASIKPTGNAVT